MKFSERQNVALENQKIETAWKNNAPLLREAFQRYNTPIPEGLAELVKSKCIRLDKVIPVTFEEFTKRWPEESSSVDAPAMKIVEDLTKSHFPVLYLYTPELQEKVVKATEQRHRTGNYVRLSEQLKKVCKKDASDEFKCFVMEVLPVELPNKVYFDGNAARVERLSVQPNAKCYGDSEQRRALDVFGVIYPKDGEEILTIFIEGLDYINSFARHLVNKLGVAEDVATKISSALPHDVYYTVRGYIETDMEKHATQMARLLCVQEGDTVHDLYQGDVEVVTGVISKKLALDLDDVLPSAVLVGTKVNVYLPSNK